LSDNYAEKDILELEEESKKLNGRLNEVSNKIKDLERLFHKNNMYFPFCKFLCIEDKLDVFLSWEADENIRSTFRLYLVKISENNTLTFKHVFIETKLSERLKYVVFLDAFLEDFTHCLKELNQSL